MTEAQFDRPAGPGVSGWVADAFLGRVGAWDVHRAHQVQSSRPGELRVSTRILTADTDQDRYRATAARLRAISAHPAIVPVYSAGLTEVGRPYLVLDPRPGELLTDGLDRDGPMSLPDVLDRGFELADALVTAHAEGIVHGAITPGSVWIGGDGSALLAGFDPVRSAGLAVPARDNARSPGGVAGAPTADAAGNVTEPQAAAGQDPPTTATDVRDLALTLYAALTGESHPVGGATLLTAPAPVSRSDSFMSVIWRAIAADPAKRYPDAAQFRDAIAAVRAGRPVAKLGPRPGTPSAPADPDDERPPGSKEPFTGTPAVARSTPTGATDSSRARMTRATVLVLLVLVAAIVTVIVLLLR